MFVDTAILILCTTQRGIEMASHRRSRIRRRLLALLVVHEFERVTQGLKPRTVDGLESCLYQWGVLNPAIVEVEFPDGEYFHIQVIRKGNQVLSSKEVLV